MATPRDRVQTLALTLLAPKGGVHFTKISQQDVAAIYGFYNDEAFSGELPSVVIKINSARISKPITLPRKSPLELIVFPIALADEPNRLRALLDSMEHSIIEILIFKHAPDVRLQSTRDHLHKCISEKFLGPAPIAPFAPTTLTRRGWYSFWSNSCYLDTVLTVIMENVSEHWRNAILDTDLSQTKYTTPEVRAACPGNTVESYRSLAISVQTALKRDFSATATKRCESVRRLLGRCIPEIARGGIFEANRLYGVLVNMFPSLLLSIPFIRYTATTTREGEIEWTPGPLQKIKLEYLNMWDYLDPLTDVESEPGSGYVEYQWDRITEPVLVFFNSATPRVKNFAKPGREVGFNIVGAGVHRYDVTKARAFAECLPFSSTVVYELVGVITLHGVSPFAEGGAHYTGYFRTSEGWVFYNDIGPVVKSIEKLPTAGVFEEKGGEMPAMYFYVRASSRLSRDAPAT